jgi:putative acetyltransferase
MVIIRPENFEDLEAIRRVNEAAFGRSNEADLVDALRRSERILLSLVAVKGGEVVGNIVFSPVSIESELVSRGALALAPMAVAPALQRQGIGSLLVRHGLEKSRLAGYSLVVVVGHPEYYPRFGFIPAKPKGLKCQYDVPDEAFMVAELQPGSLRGFGGIVRYPPEFDLA